MVAPEGWLADTPPDSISYAFLPDQDLIYKSKKVFEFLLCCSCGEFFLCWFLCLFSRRRKKIADSPNIVRRKASPLFKLALNMQKVASKRKC